MQVGSIGRQGQSPTAAVVGKVQYCRNEGMTALILATKGKTKGKNIEQCRSKDVGLSGGRIGGKAKRWEAGHVWVWMRGLAQAAADEPRQTGCMKWRLSGWW